MVTRTGRSACGPGGTLDARRARGAASGLGRALAGVLVLAAGATLARAQAVSGVVFDDVNGNGVQDAGEPGLDGATVTVYDGTGTASALTALGGAFTIPKAAGCHGLSVLPPDATWRRSFPDQSFCPSGPPPEGSLRYAAPEHLQASLAAPGFYYISLGDSIAAGVSACFWLDTNYVDDVGSDLQCIRGRAVSPDNRAVAGWHSEDLLTPRNGASANPQFIPNVVAAAPNLVTISIGGNDFLDTEPGTSAGQGYPYAASDLQTSFTQLVATRQNLQEILSVLTSELPQADIEINTVYDNQSGTCATTDFHAAATMMWNQVLRSSAWGQVRPASSAEVEWDFAHQDALRTTCCGPQNEICPLDTIHPNDTGAIIIEHAVVESLGGVAVDAAAGAPGVNLGYEHLVATLSPTVATVVSGTVTYAQSALALDGVGAQVAPDGAVLDLSGFTLPPGIVPTRVVVGVRYRTTGTFTDDHHRFAASVLDFAAPQYTFTGWDTQTPIVGSAGTSGNLGTPCVVNALQNVANWRDASALLTLNATDDGRTTGYFTWPTPTAGDIAALKVRLSTETVGTPDPGLVEWDGAWAWVYGSVSGPVPGEVSGRGNPVPLRVARAGAAYRISYASTPDAATYRIYRGSLGSFDQAACDPVALEGGCTAALSFDDTPAADAAGNWFWLVAGVSSAGAQGPLGYRNDDPAQRPHSSLAARCP